MEFISPADVAFLDVDTAARAVIRKDLFYSATRLLLRSYNKEHLLDMAGPTKQRFRDESPLRGRKLTSSINGTSMSYQSSVPTEKIMKAVPYSATALYRLIYSLENLPELLSSIYRLFRTFPVRRRNSRMLFTSGHPVPRKIGNHS